GGHVTHLLDLTHGAGLRGRLCGTGDRIEVRLLGPLVGEDESDVGLVGCHRGDTGIHIHVIPDGNIIVAFCGVRHIPLAENGVDKAVVVHSVIIVLLHNQIRVIDVVHPVGDLLIILALPGNGVHQNGPLDVRAAEEADGLHHAGADPVGLALFIDLKHRIGKHICGIVEPQVAGQIPP
ncbi:Protein of putative function DUF45, partial [Dysosmobacter welbionis]